MFCPRVRTGARIVDEDAGNVTLSGPPGPGIEGPESRRLENPGGRVTFPGISVTRSDFHDGPVALASRTRGAHVEFPPLPAPRPSRPRPQPARAVAETAASFFSGAGRQARSSFGPSTGP